MALISYVSQRVLLLSVGPVQVQDWEMMGVDCLGLSSSIFAEMEMELGSGMILQVCFSWVPWIHQCKWAIFWLRNQRIGYVITRKERGFLRSLQMSTCEILYMTIRKIIIMEKCQDIFKFSHNIIGKML